MLVQLLCRRFSFVCHDELKIGAVTDEQCKGLIEAYQSSKILKYRSYHNACWEDLPKNFDGDKILSVLKR